MLENNELTTINKIKMRKKYYQFATLLFLLLSVLTSIYHKLAPTKLIIFLISTFIATIEYWKTLKMLEKVLYKKYKLEFEEFKKNAIYGGSWFRVKVFIRSSSFNECEKSENIKVLLSIFKSYNRTRGVWLIMAFLFLILVF